MTNICIRVCFMSEMHKLREILDTILKDLKNEIPDITEEDLFDLCLIYNELLTNAFIHGNKCDSTKKVELIIDINNHNVLSVIKDEGSGFDFLQFDIERAAQDLFSESGRGLLLVKSLTDRLIFHETGNKIEFQKRVCTTQ